MSKHKEPTQRQLRVGENIRHILAELFMRDELIIKEGTIPSMTVSEVRISPDMRNASAYIYPLSGQGGEDIVSQLNKQTLYYIQKILGKRLKLKYIPRVHFVLDTSFETAAHIGTLLNKVRQDDKAEDETSDS